MEKLDKGEGGISYVHDIPYDKQMSQGKIEGTPGREGKI